MDFWASMEHILYYKFDKQLPSHVAEELKDAARAADELDQKMLRLRREILELAEGNPCRRAGLSFHISTFLKN